MSIEGSNKVYSILSRFYDLFDLIFLLGGKGNPRFGLLEALRDTQLQILDVCVGTAASSIRVATHYQQSQILGIDISDAMLSVGRRKVIKKKLTNLKLINMPADAMQFADKSFDAIMVSFSLHEFEYDLRERIFKEISRVLKPGGKLCVIDFARQCNRSNQAFMKVWTLIEPPCFLAFLDIDWRAQFNAYGLRFESEKEYSFSNLYVLRKE
jgi:demethylmenaquinone methyltransferase/2-methoxy-6-polyprenyl-1,4-benzoquinol methylase